MQKFYGVRVDHVKDARLVPTPAALCTTLALKAASRVWNGKLQVHDERLTNHFVYAQ